jgi:hypothetical protein
MTLITANSNLSFYATNRENCDYELARTHKNSLELSDYFIGHKFNIIFESESGIEVQDILYGKKKFFIRRSECQCFDFE